MTDKPSIPSHLGRYEIVRELGQGAMGIVYEGRDPHLGRRLAIKTARKELTSGPTSTPEAMERFMREARVAAMISHPNIITVYDVGEDNGQVFIAMEFIEGEDLAERMASRRRPAPKEAAELVATLAEALAFAHDQGVVHRDIKPANVMLPAQGPPKIADFGIARVSDSNLTMEGTLIGTPSYMSPEQFMGQRADGRSDLFSLGVILYELLTGEKPFTGEALSTVMHHVIKTNPVPPIELNITLDHALNEVTLQALQKRPQERYQDGRAFAAALRESLKTNPDPAILRGGLPAGQDMVNTLVSSPAPSSDSTVLTATPPPGAADDEALAQTVLTPTPTEQTLQTPPHPKDKKKSMLPLILGVVASVLLVLAGTVMFLEKKSVQNVSKSTPVIVPSTPVESTTLQPKMATLRILAYETKNFEVAVMFNGVTDPEELEKLRKEHASEINPVRRAGASAVAVNDPLGKAELVATEPLKEDGSALLNVPENLQKVAIRIAGNGLDFQEDCCRPDWKTARMFVIFVKE